MLGRTDRRLRMVALFLVFATFAGAAIARLSYWQVSMGPELVERARAHMASLEPPAPPRAEIVDRDGVALAQTATFDSLVAYPRDIPDDRRAEILETLAELLELDASERQVYLEKLSRSRPWERLERRLTPQQSIAVQLAKDDGKLPSIALDPMDERLYARKGGQAGTTLASQLLGFVAGDSGGAAGIERLYEDRLSGREASPAVASIAGSAGITTGSLADPELGDLAPPPLRLTIDAGLQRQVEADLNAVRIQNRARSVSAIVMDPHTGEIFASASVPAYDANDFASVFKDDPKAVRDRVVSDLYEPGSVMKMFTVAAALSEGVVTPQTRIRDQNALHFGPKTVRNADRKSLGVRPVKTIIAESRNVGTAKIAQRLGSTQKAGRLLYGLWRRVGVTGRTGVDIAGEEAGIAADPARQPWQPVDLANRSFGQGVAVTLIQLATGYSAFMNGGFHIQPHVVVDGDAARVAPERVLKPKVARQTQEILTWVTGSVYRYAKGSLVPGYVIGGKTGTAQIWDARKGKYKVKRYNHSFVGFVGSERPDVVIAIRIEEPVPISLRPLDLKVESYEVFQRLARAAIRHLDIPKSSDPDAGWPIRGTQAARMLTPGRAKPANPDRRAEGRAGAQRGDRARRQGDGSDRAVGGVRAERRGDRGGAAAGDAGA